MRVHRPDPAHYGNLAVLKVLLMAEIFVRGDKHLDTCRLGSFQQLAVVQFLSSTGARLRDHVTINQKAGNRSRCPVIEEDQHYITDGGPALPRCERQIAGRLEPAHA